MSNYQDIYYQSQDNLTLYARDYGNDKASTTILCMHGLTRNSADFEELCEHLQKNYRVIAVDQRGRGLSAYDPNPANYNPAVYVGDMFTLLDQLSLQQVILIGTSMGGLMTMMMAAMQPQRFLAAIINDIGPVIDPGGLERIKRYVGKAGTVGNWQEAAAQAKAVNEVAFPNYSDDEWLHFAKKLYHEDSQSIPVLAYDPAISQPISSDQEKAIPADLWPAFELMKTLPLLVIRGETSDILSPLCIQEMQQRKPDTIAVEVPGIGHAPMLIEPAALGAIERFLGSLSN